MLRDQAWDMFQAIEKHTKVKYGSAALDDVTSTNPPKSDTMESFWTAETLKYFYLIFSSQDLISLDEYVFNTEAHPFKRPKWLGSTVQLHNHICLGGKGLASARKSKIWFVQKASELKETSCTFPIGQSVSLLRATFNAEISQNKANV